jgi:repressor LexA
LARKGVIELVGGTSRGIRLKGTHARQHREAANMQFSQPLVRVSHLHLPLVGRVAAGSPILAQEHVSQTYQVESSLFLKPPDYLLRVRGMSMRDVGIVDGDLLAVQKTSVARDGQIVVARLNDEVTVKRFRKTSVGIDLLPENSEYQVIHVSNDSIGFAIEGIAVGLIRPEFSN